MNFFLDPFSSIVRSYLVHYGYEDTLRAFDTVHNTSDVLTDASNENGITKHDDIYQLRQRRALREIIRSGNIDAAFEKLETWYPKITEVKYPNHHYNFGIIF
uniref:LisH domain-containing protein n=1 Tax=Kalanchoe fedtschenkoi TaxID=63787 RepID=A0A7N0RIL8_KALFE